MVFVFLQFQLDLYICKSYRLWTEARDGPTVATSLKIYLLWALWGHISAVSSGIFLSLPFAEMHDSNKLANVAIQ